MQRVLWLALCVHAAALGAACGDELSLAPREGVVLLSNGELLSGQIIAAGDRYDVRLDGGEISVKRSDVAMICRDAAECYRRRRAAIEAGRPQDHLALAEWCIKHELLDSAKRELAAARALDARHPKIRLVEARLELALLPPKKELSASAESRAPETPDNVARDLPAGTMEAFTNTIQPMLLNYCAKGGCHAGRSRGGLKLERIHPKRSGRSATQRNLRSVLALVDRENPPESKLLLAPIRPHGTVQAPIFTDREQSQYKQLVLWVFAVTKSRKVAQRPTLAERTAPLLQTVPRADGRSAPGGDELPAEESPAGDGPAADRRDGSRIPPSSADQAFTRQELRAMGALPRAWSNVQYGADQQPEFVPEDPFDPEIFNRRFFDR